MVDDLDRRSDTVKAKLSVRRTALMMGFHLPPVTDIPTESLMEQVMVWRNSQFRVRRSFL
jgi:hypothetical protein